MKGILAQSEFFMVDRTATAAAGSDKVLTEIDCGNAQNGTLILYVEPASSSDLANVEVWTSRLTSFASAGTQVTAVTSDSTRKVAIASDADGIVAVVSAGADLTTKLTVSSNKISAISEEGMYAINCKDVARYLTVQYDSDGVGSYVTSIFIGHDLEEGPWEGARSAYT